jgi:hypothetical protein
MYVRRMDLGNIEARIVRDVDPERLRKITSSTLEGLAKRELNLTLGHPLFEAVRDDVAERARDDLKRGAFYDPRPTRPCDSTHSARR